MFKPCPASGACTTLGRGPGIALPPGAAGGTHQKESIPQTISFLSIHRVLGSQIWDQAIAEVTSDRTNLSPFTKDYRGEAS